MTHDRRIRGRLERIDGARAQKRLPPPIAGMEAGAFNASTMLPPNPIVMGNVMGEQAPVTSHLFQLYPTGLLKVQLSTVPQA